MAQQFTKNDSRINRRGRKVGTANKTTQQLRALVQAFIENNVDDIQTLYDKLDERQKLQFFERMLRVVLPAPQEELQTLSDESIDKLIARLKEQA